ncbi:hypothetical protein HD806DRAFT_475701 [Xylariaceae sp. AK1471]|nr:hypothetical protein HD806DRAFT_475701 [Xylariaceae sp. AK1471]
MASKLHLFTSGVILSFLRINSENTRFCETDPRSPLYRTVSWIRTQVRLLLCTSKGCIVHNDLWVAQEIYITCVTPLDLGIFTGFEIEARLSVCLRIRAHERLHNVSPCLSTNHDQYEYVGYLFIRVFDLGFHI